jgi:hypothetical protein
MGTWERVGTEGLIVTLVASQSPVVLCERYVRRSSVFYAVVSIVILIRPAQR